MDNNYFREREDRINREGKAAKSAFLFVLGTWAIGVFVIIAFWIGIALLAWHFIAKFW